MDSQRLYHFEGSGAATNRGGRGVLARIAVVDAVDGGRASGGEDGLVAKLLEATRIPGRGFGDGRGDDTAVIIEERGI